MPPRCPCKDSNISEVMQNPSCLLSFSRLSVLRETLGKVGIYPGKIRSDRLFKIKSYNTRKSEEIFMHRLTCLMRDHGELAGQERVCPRMEFTLVHGPVLYSSVSSYG